MSASTTPTAYPELAANDPRRFHWHRKPKGFRGKRCPVCDCSGRVTGEHRQATESGSSRRYLHRMKTAEGYVEKEIGAPFVVRYVRAPYGPTPKILQRIARIAAMLADGKTMRAIAVDLGIHEQNILEQRAKYPEIWKRALDNAMAAMAAVVEAQAGTLDVLADPAGFLARAAAAKKWSDEAGRPFLPVKEGTLRSFFELYYRPVRLGDVSAATVQNYERSLRY